MTYDEKCGDLARYFLPDDPDGIVSDLAVEIQRSIENWMERQIPNIGQKCPTKAHADGVCCPACDHMVGRCVHVGPEPATAAAREIQPEANGKKESEPAEGMK